MSTTVINVSSTVNGQATDVVSVALSDSAAVYGLKRTDTGAILVAAGTALTRLSIGSYQYILTDPAADLTYDYVVKIAGNDGITRYYPRVGGSATILNHLYTTPTSSHYSSEAEVMRILGNPTIENMTDEWESTDTSPIWTQILQTVDGNIDQHVGKFYARASIISNTFIRGNAAYMAAHLLSIRRGNPGLYLRINEEIFRRLDEISSGRLLIPGAVPLGRRAPVISNYKMQPFALTPSRVILSKSTGQSYESGLYSWEPYYYWW